MHHWQCIIDSASRFTVSWCVHDRVSRTPDSTVEPSGDVTGLIQGHKGRWHHRLLPSPLADPNNTFVVALHIIGCKCLWIIFGYGEKHQTNNNTRELTSFYSVNLSIKRCLIYENVTLISNCPYLIPTLPRFRMWSKYQKGEKLTHMHQYKCVADPS